MSEEEDLEEKIKSIENLIKSRFGEDNTVFVCNCTKKEKELLTFGFIHRIQTEINKIIPSDTIELCAKFFIDNSIYFYLGNDLSKPIQLQSNRTQILTGNKCHLLVSTQPIKQDMSGIYEWNLKCIKKFNNDNVGIVEKIGSTTDASLYNIGYGDSYYWLW